MNHSDGTGMLLQIHILMAARRRLGFVFLALFVVSLAIALGLAWSGAMLSQATVVGLGVLFGLAAASVVLLALLQVSADANLFASPVATAVRDKMPTAYLLFLVFAVFVCGPAYIFDWFAASNIFPVFGDPGRWPSFVVRGYGLSLAVGDFCFWALVKWSASRMGKTPT